MNKNIVTTPAKAVKDVALYVTDYTEVGVDKVVAKTHFGTEKVVDGAQVVGRKVKVTWTAHRNAKADRLVKRASRRETRKIAKMIQADETK